MSDPRWWTAKSVASPRTQSKPGKERERERQTDRDRETDSQTDEKTEYMYDREAER